MENLKLYHVIKVKKLLQKNKLKGFFKMSYIPSPDKCIELLKITGCSKEVINHCIAVRDVAVKIANKADANIKLVEVGSLLHDIGRSKTHGLSHAIAGCEIAEKLGLSRDIISIIRNHIGAGITKKEARERGLPPQDYIPHTIEEKIVAGADNLAFGDELQTISQAEQNMHRQGIYEGAERCVILHRELSKMCGIDLDELLAEKIKSMAPVINP